MQALILYSQDWAYFSAWSEFVDLASKAGASALLLVNPDEAVHTLQDASNYTTTMGVWNMDYKCGAALSYLTSLGTRTHPPTHPPTHSLYPLTQSLARSLARLLAP